MAIRNPFEFSQYSSSFTADNILLDSSGIGITGISDLMSFVVTQTKIRQEAVRIGYIDNNPGIPQGSYDFVNLDNLLFDTPGSIFFASEKIRDSILQMFRGHISRIYERSAYKPTLNPNEPPDDGVYDEGRAGGFFHKISEGGDPEDVYYEFISDLVHGGSSVFFDDIDRIGFPPNFINYIALKDYLADQVRWINSVISILNQLRFIHKKIVVTYPFAQVESGNSNSGCDYSYSISSNTVSGDTGDPVVNKPIEIILDMSEVVSSCTDGFSSYGYLCISWTSLGSPSRIVIMPTVSPSGDPSETEIIRKPIWGSTSPPDISTQEPQVHNGNSGYYNSSLYDTLASGQDLIKTWDIGGSFYERIVSPIIDSSCSLTDEFSPILPFRNGSQQNADSDFVCLKITNDYFTTNTGDPWDNKLRLVIFPTCSPFDGIGFSWNLNINCIGCIDCNANNLYCGGTPFNGSSSSSSQSICNFSQNFSFNGRCLNVIELDLSEAPVQGSSGERYIDLCFDFETFGLKDRFIFLASKGIDNDSTSLLRQAPWFLYGSCPQPANTAYLSSRPFNTPEHPRLGSSGDSPSLNDIIFDSECVGTQGRRKNIITVEERHVEMDNQSDPWYKKIRLFCFGGCDVSQNSNSSQYDFAISCNINQCDQLSSSSSSSSSSNCIGYGSKVYLYDGTKKSVENIRVGDELLSAVFTDAESKDNPELNDLVSGWSISDSSKLRLVKTYVKSIFIGTEPEIYRFSNEIYLTYDHPVLVGQPDGSYNFVSAKYLSSSVEVISSNREVSYLYPAEVIPNKFVTFTIVTEPYNSIFVGGVLVHNASREHSQSIAGVGKFYDSSYDISHYQKVFGASYLPFNDEVLNPFSNSYINDGMYETLAISGPNGPIEGTSGSGSPTLEERIDDIVSDIDSGPGGPEIPPSSSSSSGEDDFSSSSSSSDGGGGGGSSSSSDDGSSSSSSDNGGGGSSSSSDGSSSSSSGGGGSSSSSSFGGSSSSSSSSSSSDDVFSSSSSSSKFTFS